jgi:hypothetical protein
MIVCYLVSVFPRRHHAAQIVRPVFSQRFLLTVIKRTTPVERFRGASGMRTANGGGNGHGFQDLGCIHRSLPLGDGGKLCERALHLADIGRSDDARDFLAVVHEDQSRPELDMK